MFETFYRLYPKIGEILNQLRSGVIIGDPWSKERLSRLYEEMMEKLVKEIRGAIKIVIGERFRRRGLWRRHLHASDP